MAGGHKTVLDTGSTMDEFVAGVKRVTDLIGEICLASGEQDLGIAQVSQSVAAFRLPAG